MDSDDDHAGSPAAAAAAAVATETSSSRRGQSSNDNGEDDVTSSLANTDDLSAVPPEKEASETSPFTERLEKLDADLSNIGIILSKRILFLQLLVYILAFVVLVLAILLSMLWVSTRSSDFDKHIRPLATKIDKNAFHPCQVVDPLVLRFADTCIGNELATDVRSLRHHIDSLGLVGVSSYHIGSRSCVLAFRREDDDSDNRVSAKLYTMVNPEIIYRGDEKTRIRQRDRLCSESRIVDLNDHIEVQWHTFVHSEDDDRPFVGGGNDRLTRQLRVFQETFTGHDAYILQQLIDRLHGENPC